MNKLPVDLRSRHPPPRWAWMALGLLLISTVVLIGLAVWSQRQLQASRAELAALESQANQTPEPKPSQVRPIPQYDGSARIALAQAEAGWGALLASLESVEVVGVTPISIDVIVADRQVRVDVEFVDFASMLKFVEELNAGEASARWQLVHAQGVSRTVGGVNVAPVALPVATIRGVW